MKKNLIFLFVGATFFATTLNAQAVERGSRVMDGTGPHHYAAGPHYIGGEGCWNDRMGLTKEQQTKMTAVRDKYRDRLSKQRETLSTARKEYQQALASDASAKDLKKSHKKLQDESAKLSHLRFKIMLETREILTPEQRQKMGHGQMRRGSKRTNKTKGTKTTK